MNRYAAFWGVLVAASGVVMHFLLQALGEETFFMAPVYLPPAQDAATALALVGVALVTVGAFFDWPRYVAWPHQRAGKYFVRLAFVNALAAVAMASAMLFPPLELPILFTEWPGIYIAIAYGSFVGFGVLGMFAWGELYRSLPEYFGGSLVDRRSLILQLVLSEVGVVVVSASLFAGGYVGASLAHGGTAGIVHIGASMEVSDIPAALAIFTVMVSVVLGAVNVLGAKRAPP